MSWCKCCGCIARISIIWRSSAPKCGRSGSRNAAERPVGILGFGTLGKDAGRKLGALGFDVVGWSRTAKAVGGFATFAGADGLDQLAGRNEILVSLQPLTAATEGILNGALFSRLPRGAALVKCRARGTPCRSGSVPGPRFRAVIGGGPGRVSRGAAAAGASLLASPAHHLTPHIAAETHPPTAALIIRNAIRRFEAGLPLDKLIDPARGY